MALPRHHRLKTKKQFDRLYRQGRITPTPLFLIRSWREPKPEPIQIGIVISKKIDRRATRRNRWRRQISEALREIIKAQESNLSGFKVIIIARPRLRSASRPEIDYWLRQFFGKYAEKNQSD